MDAVLRAIAEPHRRSILLMVLDHEMAAGEIAGHFAVTRAAISQHIGVLRDAGLVEERRQGTRRLYRARPEALFELRQFLDQFWASALDRLKTAAEQEERRLANRDIH